MHGQRLNQVSSFPRRQPSTASRMRTHSLPVPVSCLGRASVGGSSRAEPFSWHLWDEGRAFTPLWSLSASTTPAQGDQCRGGAGEWREGGRRCRARVHSYRQDDITNPKSQIWDRKDSVNSLVIKSRPRLPPRLPQSREESSRDITEARAADQPRHLINQSDGSPRSHGSDLLSMAANGHGCRS